VVGYSRLMGADEEGTHERLKAHLREVVDPKIRGPSRADRHLRSRFSPRPVPGRDPRRTIALLRRARLETGSGVRSHVAILRTLAFRVGRRVRISFAPAASQQTFGPTREIDAEQIGQSSLVSPAPSCFSRRARRSEITGRPCGKEDSREHACCAEG
jgi:hypothetical protein